jgi:HEAT repeat protein
MFLVVMSARKQCEDAGVAIAEIDRLEKIGDRESVLQIIKLADNPNVHYQVKIRAMSALVEMRSEEGLPFLERIFREGQIPLLVHLAAYTIGQIGTEQAVTFLLANIGDEREYAFDGVCEGLLETGDPRAIAALEEVAHSSQNEKRRQSAKDALEIYKRTGAPKNRSNSEDAYNRHKSSR